MQTRVHPPLGAVVDALREVVGILFADVYEGDIERHQPVHRHRVAITDDTVGSARRVCEQAIDGSIAHYEMRYGIYHAPQTLVRRIVPLGKDDSLRIEVESLPEIDDFGCIHACCCISLRQLKYPTTAITV